MTRKRKFYQTHLNIFQTVNDNDSYYLYKLKNSENIRNGEFPWEFVRRYSSKEDLFDELMNRLSVSSIEILSKYEVDEKLINTRINLYRNH